MRDPDPFVELRRLPHPIAQIVRGALEAEGIETDVRTGLGQVYGVDAGPFATSLYVRHSDVARAEELIAEVEAGP
jgi:kynureninase